MVKGIEIFRKYFEAFPDNYIIIGGTARDFLITEAGFIPKGTKDIDVILVVEALSPDFARTFWQFIKDGNYGYKEINPDKRKYYRFTYPEQPNFPLIIELFSRIPDLIELPEGIYLTPIPVGKGVSSLSAILLNDDYYTYILNHCSFHDGLMMANVDALICMKAIAYIEMINRKQQGLDVDQDDIKKHKADIFRLGATLAPADLYELPPAIKADLQSFVFAIKDELPGKDILKRMGLLNLDAATIYTQICKTFNLNAE